jgi:ornithine decarboxylase
MKNGNGAQTPIPLPKPAIEPGLTFDRAAALAATVPTPFMVLAPSRIQHSIRTLRTCLPGVELYYAMKSNPDPELLALLNGLVDGIDVASYQEVLLAAAAGVTPERLFHSHPIKKDSDITACTRHGVQWFTFDNPDEIPKLRRHAPDARVLLRVAIKNDSCVVDLGAKYGARPEDALALILEARAAGVNVCGIAFHVGSQSSDPAIYLTALKAVRQLFDEAAAAGVRLDTLDIGGGFPIVYRNEMISLEDFCRVVSRGLSQLFPAGVRILAEPGRCISGDSMTLVVRVIGRSVRNGVPWYFIDDGLYGAFSGKLFDHCDYELIPQRVGPVHECVVAGPTCDSIDIVSRDQPLPNLEVGDLLLVPSMGAYTKASATSFNGFQPPVTVVDDGQTAPRKRTRRVSSKRRPAGPRGAGEIAPRPVPAPEPTPVSPIA